MHQVGAERQEIRKAETFHSGTSNFAIVKAAGLSVSRNEMEHRALYISGDLRQ